MQFCRSAFALSAFALGLWGAHGATAQEAPPPKDDPTLQSIARSTDFTIKPNVPTVIRQSPE